MCFGLLVEVVVRLGGLGGSPIFTVGKSGRFIEDVGLGGSHRLCREHDPGGGACTRIVLIPSSTLLI
jgi:hypothetical protein